MYHNTIADEQSTAQAELNQYAETQAQAIAPEIEVDSDIDPEFGELYRIWYSYHLLGTFYQASDGKWIAQPCDSAAAFGGNLPPKTCLDDRPRCNTAAEAQLLIVAMSGLLVADAEEDAVDLLDKPFDELTVAEWQAIKQQAMQAELAAA